METLFSKYPEVQINGKLAKNLLIRYKFDRKIYNNSILYYPYSISAYERPDMIADREYDDQYLSWLIYLTNNMIDPYYDWYLNEDELNKLLIKKYGSYANAVNKIKYFRNNWYLDTNNIISASAYNALPSNLKLFYEPIMENGLITESPKNYKRREVDWKINTNYIILYNVNNSNNFIKDEIIDIKISPTSTGSGQLIQASNNKLILQHFTGTFTGTITSQSNLKGRESKTSATILSYNIIRNNIPAGEATFWSPVTYFEYEQEINENKKIIQLLKKEYLPTIIKDLERVLKETNE